MAATCMPIITPYMEFFFTISFSFPDIDLQPKSWFQIRSNLHCINISSIEGNAEGAEGLIEVSPRADPCGEISIKRISLFGEEKR